MKKMRLWIMLLAFPAGISLFNWAWAGKGTKNPKWFRCSVISDCTVAQGLCGDPTGVNVLQLDSFQRWVARRQASIRCAGGIPSIERALLTCEKGMCLAGQAPAGKNSPRLSFATDGTCKEISDCTVSRSVCGNPLGIPWTKRKEWEQDVRRRAVAVDCAGPVGPVRRAILACERGRCQAGPDPSPREVPREVP